MKRKNKARAIVLFSGGLDSRLVAKILQEQGIDVELLYFNLPFGCGCCNNLSCNFNFSQTGNFSLHILDCTKGELFKEYLEIVKNPKYGYGKAMNPCISCRIFMLKKAKELLKKFKCSFIATGEVLGQRPMSQYKKAMLKIEEEAEVIGLVLRPLSAKLLGETLAEKQGLVDRNKLLAINGRKRNIQMQLAKKYDIRYPSPAGGCLLCDKFYSLRLSDLLEHNSNPTCSEIESLNGFRHFRNKGKIILGKNYEENLKLQELNKNLKYNIITELDNHPGPTCLYEREEDKKLAENLIRAYSSSNLEERKKFEEYRVG